MDIFRKAASALEEGRSVALVTVIATTGSTPGKVGYQMLVLGQGGGIAGTVGGGLLEAKMIEEARSMLDRPTVRLLRFHVGETPDDEKGICGGSIEFLIETFDKAAVPLFQKLSGVSEDREGGVLISILSQGEAPRKMRLRDGEYAAVPFPPEIVAAIREVAASGGAGTKVSAGGADVFIESLAVPPTVVLFGAGHVACHIARYVRSVHFGVVVCDDRSEYANRERFPDAEEIIVEDFGRAFERMRIDGHSYLVIVTRGHQHDEIVLEQAVRTEARYIGMIGSRRKTLTLLQKLRDKGVPKDRLDRVYAPIGVSIGAITAEEIALSIVCELVKVRRLGDEAGIGHMSLSRREAGL
ncbi:MAG: XdhC family protein [Phycisphaerae bacterium]|nr:XdhC family protein [Phycisphaerae bacterium]